LKHCRPATAGDALIILGRADTAIAKHKETASQALKPWKASSIEEQALHRPGKAYRDKLSNAYEGKS
jgi:hypothetical protein